jgi:hypothetical protein
LIHDSIFKFLDVFKVEIVAYMLTFGVGVGTVPWLLLGELCPIQVKSALYLNCNTVLL